MLVYLRADFGMFLCYYILHTVMSFVFGAHNVQFDFSVFLYLGY